MKRTKEEILDSMINEMPYRLPKETHPYILEAMEMYKKQTVDELYDESMRLYEIHSENTHQQVKYQKIASLIMFIAYVVIFVLLIMKYC